MTPLFRLMNPSSLTRSGSNAAKIHYESANGQASMCSQVRVFQVVDGEKMRVWHRTKRDVTCVPCITALCVMVRKEMGTLTGEQLEDLRAHIDTFHHRYGHDTRS